MLDALTVIDPFAIKRHPKWHPLRVASVATSRGLEVMSRALFPRAALPLVTISDVEPQEADGPLEDTAVTRRQLAYLRHALAAAERTTGTVAVEVGAFRGATTHRRASSTALRYVVVDPYAGYGGGEQDLAAFQARTGGLPNVEHQRVTSGAAARSWRLGRVAFLFVDAVHDFVNTSFDLAAWSPLLAPGALVAMHDTDAYAYAGTRLAAWRFARGRELVAHVENLVIVRMPGPI